MPRLKRKSYEQRTREAKEARKVARAQKKECVDNSVDSAKCMPVGEINAGGDGAERSDVVNGGRREDLVVNYLCKDSLLSFPGNIRLLLFQLVVL